MGKRRNQIRVKDLSRFMVYVLGHRPDEFGLVPDRDGFVSYKELLQAIHEEQGWRHVTRSHINEVLLGKDRKLFQAEDAGIRVREMHWHKDLKSPTFLLPNILFIPVRRRAHPVAMEKGLKSSGTRSLVLSPDRHMAMRIGRRRDQNPVVLEVKAKAAASRGARFYTFGDLFLSKEIPVDFIPGPPVSKELLERRRTAKAEKEDSRKADFTPGTFTLDISRDPDPNRRAQGKKSKGWKEDARKLRKKKLR